MLGNVLYILPMLLGRTFDVRYDRVGIDIFPQSELDKQRIIESKKSVSGYKTSYNSQDLRDFLDVSPDLALKIKAGKVDFKGTGSYLKDSSKMGRVVEILTRVKFETVTVALPTGVKPFRDWTQKNRDDLGTHYVKSISYGGELLASIRFKANKENDFYAISAEIQANFTGGDPNSLVAEGKLEKMESRLKDKASMEISYYATVPLKGVPNTIEGLRDIVQGFKDHVLEVNDGWGVPIRVELGELSTLEGADSTSFKFLHYNSSQDGILKEMEIEFDDLRKAQSMLKDWYRSLPLSITPEQEDKINKLYTRIGKILRPYYDSIGKLNIEQDLKEQVKAARDAYREGKEIVLPGRFTKEVRRLKNEIVVVEKKLYGTGTGSYTRWGYDSCPSSLMMHQLFVGFMAATTNRGIGGSSTYLCLPNDPGTEDDNPNFGNEGSNLVSGVKYGLLDDHPFTGDYVRNYFGKGVPCTLCHMTNRTLVHVFPAQYECPENWIKEYSGYMMAGSNLPGNDVCVDEEPKYVHDVVEKQAHSLSLIQVADSDSGLSKPPYVKKAAVKCVVCSR